MPGKVSDSELLVKFRAGCMNSYQDLIQRYHCKVYSLAYRLTRQPDDAQEVLQDVFVAVFRKSRGFEGKSSFSSWLYRITVNAALMKLRKNRQNRCVGMEEAIPDYMNSALLKGAPQHEADAVLQRNQVAAILEEAIRKLPDEYRPVFVLRDIDGMTSREVGRILDLSVPAVKSRLHRSRLMLRRLLLSFYREYQSGLNTKAAVPAAAGNL